MATKNGDFEILFDEITFLLDGDIMTDREDVAAAFLTSSLRLVVCGAPELFGTSSECRKTGKICGPRNPSPYIGF